MTATAWRMRWRRTAMSRRSTMDDADLVVLNTCHIREKASEKVFSELGRLAELRAEGARLHDRRRRLRGAGRGRGDRPPRQGPVDLVFGPQSYHRLPDLIARAERGELVLETEFPEEDKFEHLPLRRKAGDPQPRPHRLPHRAGRLRQVLLVLRRALYARRRNLAARSSRCWPRPATSSKPACASSRCSARTSMPITASMPRGRSVGLGELCARLAEIDGLARLRYTTSHPSDMTDELIEAHRDNDKLMPYLHLPVQSGSDAHPQGDEPPPHPRRVPGDHRAHQVGAAGHGAVGRFHRRLSRRNRCRFRGRRSSIVREVGYASAYTFKYSIRPGTPGASHGRSGCRSGQDRAPRRGSTT